LPVVVARRRGGRDSGRAVPQLSAGRGGEEELWCGTHLRAAGGGFVAAPSCQCCWSGSPTSTGHGGLKLRVRRLLRTVEHFGSFSSVAFSSKFRGPVGPNDYRAVTPYCLLRLGVVPACRGVASPARWRRRRLDLIAFLRSSQGPLCEITGQCSNFYFFGGLSVICPSLTIMKAVYRVLCTRLHSKKKDYDSYG
jgi:hypothetical protein